jgi:hypothetical protein
LVPDLGGGRYQRDYSVLAMHGSRLASRIDAAMLC